MKASRFYIWSESSCFLACLLRVLCCCARAEALITFVLLNGLNGTEHNSRDDLILWILVLSLQGISRPFIASWALFSSTGANSQQTETALASGTRTGPLSNPKEGIHTVSGSMLMEP